MDELIEFIRAAVATGASAEQKTRGANACRAILTALDTEPGKPLAVASAPTAHPLAGVPPGQVLDLLIAKLTAALPPDGDKNAKQPSARQSGVRIKFVPVPRAARTLGAHARPTTRRKP